MADKWPLRRPKLPSSGIHGLLVILALVLLTTSAQAHRMLVFSYAEGDTVRVESKFVPDTPVHQGKVLVLDSETGKKLLTGQTDEQGKFSFKIPAEARAENLDLKIVVESSLGHRGEWLLKADSYLGGASPGKTTEPGSAAAPAAKASETRSVPLDQQALEAALQKVLERQLAPIKEKLAELTVHRTSLTDIIGGLGYIMGLFGLWAYLQGKRRKDS